MTQSHSLVEDTLCDFPLGGFGDFDDIVTGDNCHSVAVGVEANTLQRNVVDDDGIEIFRD